MPDPAKGSTDALEGLRRIRNWLGAKHPVSHGIYGRDSVYERTVAQDDLSSAKVVVDSAIAAWEKERETAAETAAKLRAWGEHEMQSEHTNPKARIKAFFDCADSIGMISPGTQLVPKSDLDTLRAEVLAVAEEIDRGGGLQSVRLEGWAARLRKACE